MSEKPSIVCTTNSVEYGTIRRAMCMGARTLEEVKKATNICTTCESCVEQTPMILSTLCGCNKVTMETVINKVKEGVTSVDEIAELTGAGTKFGNCKKLVENVIQLGY